ncbi:hypothetical protein GGTG_10623 [Gaeumannomyces tritici R3-111a-1]|uniref:Uncharacterized protein n=1 Tax=Gaeumannomyces tritici (strain R3-111a-1) TaxID=644352 RepID=J3PAU8_GAET3|nr:hypothetical protein GGTG_10623 [Gaeumannomyces tritici R3-111a-1]EJT71364.1 hypothetical protein GGTG_10623 [Gaeumannomyces tritici R3-111a-1]
MAASRSGHGSGSGGNKLVISKEGEFGAKVAATSIHSLGIIATGLINRNFMDAMLEEALDIAATWPNATVKPKGPSKEETKDKKEEEGKNEETEKTVAKEEVMKKSKTELRRERRARRAARRGNKTIFWSL